MTLTRHQRLFERALRDGLAGRGGDRGHQPFASGPAWRLLVDSVLFWRVLAVRRGSPFTATLLAREGRLHEVVARLCVDGLASPYTETMAAAFLDRAPNYFWFVLHP